MNKNTIRYAILNALGTALYVSTIASCLFYASAIFGPDEPKGTALIPIMMLLLLVFSVAVVGLLIFGRPVLWYLDGRKKEAVSLVISTLVIIFMIIVCVAMALYSLKV